MGDLFAGLPQIEAQKLSPEWPADAGDRFWAAWPSGPRKHSKKQVFEKLTRIRVKEEATWGEVWGGLQAYVASKPDKRYIPAPMVWLNQQRWMADYSPQKPDRPTYGDLMAGRYG